MTYFFHICMGCGLILLQTVIMPMIPLFERFYDLIIPFILYLGIFCSPYESILIIIVLSFLMDCLSGAPFGLYGTTYLWLFVGTRWGRQFLRVKNRFLLPILIALGILTENFIFFISFVILKTNVYPPGESLDIIAKQVVLAVLTGSFLPECFFYTHTLWKQWLNHLFEEEEE